jgi:regulator of sigma E protease
MFEVVIAIIAFVFAIGVLVSVHEFGHFWVARRLGFKVLRFSVGFGRPLIRWREREPGEQSRGLIRIPSSQPLPAKEPTAAGLRSPPTEYWLSSIPLGGYVKLLDEREGPVPAQDAHLAFTRRPVPHRIAVLLAGPGFNFLFAIVAYWLMFVGGVPGVKAIIGIVAEGSIAAEAGLLQDQEIIAIGGRATPTWDAAVFGILDELLTDGLIDFTVREPGGAIRLIELDVRGREAELTEPGDLFVGLGFEPGPVRPAVLGELTPGLAAERAGLRPGDRVLQLDGQVINRFTELVDAVRARPGEIVTVLVERSGRELTVEIEIGEVFSQGEELTTEVESGETVRRGERRGIIGAAENVDVLRAIAENVATTERYGVLEAFPKGLAKTWEMSALTVRMLGRMITGDVSVRNISGPINIAAYAGDSARAGLGSFLSFLSIVSISLGILNLLPVPLLDGGQIVYQLAEVVKGSPLSERAMIFGQQIGLLLLVVLMSFAFYNDLSRIFG